MKREPLLSDVEIRGSCSDDIDMDPIYVRNTYEAARAKDAELIQRLIREGSAMAALIEVNEQFIESDERRGHWHSHRVSWNAALAAAGAHGFKPTEQ